MAAICAPWRASALDVPVAPDETAASTMTVRVPDRMCTFRVSAYAIQ